MPKKKILVTGATGFVGAYLLHHLLQLGEKNIRATKRPLSPMHLVSDIEDQVEWMEADIMDTTSLEDAMEGDTQVYHCAAMVSFNGKNAGQMIRVNQTGTANVVNVALDLGVEKLLFVSSIAAIGRHKKQNIIDENTKWQDSKWNSPYATSKHLAEMEVWRGIAEGLNAVVVNPSNILGSGFWKERTSTGQFFYKIWSGFPFYPIGGSGFVDVRDVIRFMVKLMESDISAERFIINAENLPFKTILDQIALSLNMKKPRIKLTPFMGEITWRVVWLISKLTGKEPFITKQMVRASKQNFVYENGKSLSIFPFNYTPIKNTLAETAEQFLLSTKDGFRPKVLPFDSQRQLNH